VRASGLVEHLARGVRVHGVGDEALVPRAIRRIQLRLPVRARRLGLGQQPAIRRGERGQPQHLVRARHPSVGQPLRRRIRPVLAEQARDGVDRADHARHHRVTPLGVSDRVFEHVAQRQRPVVAQQRQPRADRARHHRRQLAAPGNQREPEAVEAPDRRGRR